MKICATTLGETAGDLLSMILNVGYAVSSLVLTSLLLCALLSQLAAILLLLIVHTMRGHNQSPQAS